MFVVPDDSPPDHVISYTALDVFLATPRFSSPSESVSSYVTTEGLDQSSVHPTWGSSGIERRPGCSSKELKHQAF